MYWDSQNKIGEKNMKSLTISNCLLLLLFIIPNLICHSQDSSKIIMLSKDIGPIVDLNEKLEYDILPRFKENFVSAMFYLGADSQYKCKLNLLKDQTVTDTTLILSYNSIRNTAMRVQYIESIKKGNNNFNIQNVELIFANSDEVKNIVKREEKSVTISKEINPKLYQFTFVKELPLNKQKIDYSKFIERDTYFGVSLGVLYNSASFNELGVLFNLLEENIPEDGYEIAKSDLHFNSFPIFSLSSFIIISKKFMLELKYGFNITTSSQKFLSYTTFLASLGYLQPVLKNTKLYGAIGFTGVDFDAFKNYHGVIDEYSGTLESINLNGRAKGVKLSFGIKYNISSSILIDINASQNFYSDLEIINTEGYQLPDIPSIDLDSYDIGISLSVINN